MLRSMTVCGAIPVISAPSNMMRPELGRRNPQIVFMMVDLPAPLRPIRPVMTPGATLTLTPRKMSMSAT